MGISNLYNSVKSRAKKMTGSLSNFFSGKETYINPSYEKPQAPNLQPTQPKVETPQAPQVYELANRQAQFTDEDFNKIRPLIYGEVSNRGFDKKNLEADVILNTAINRQKEYRDHGQDMSISEILAMPNQYQAYEGDQYKNYFNPQNPIEVEKKREVDSIVDRIADKIRRGEYVDNTEGAFYYVHADDNTIKYDNLRKLFAE